MPNTNTASFELASLKPDIYRALVPADAVEQKRAFLAGEIRNPNHDYRCLDRPYSDEVGRIINTGLDATQELGQNRELFEGAYDECIESFVETEELMDFMRRYDESLDIEERQQLREKIMQLNIDIYGKPEVRDYHHILASYARKIDGSLLQFKGKSLEAYYELSEGFPLIYQVEDPGGYEPRPETVKWMQEFVEKFYGDMLAHVEDDREYGPYELRDLFLEIIADAFGEEVAAEWSVDVEPAASVNVKPQEKRIVIPINRTPADSDKVKDLVVHELGVHMLRTVSGFETSLPLLGTGLANYLDSEEGLGVVMEQARKGKFDEAGHPLYLAASLAYIEGMDFHDTFEVVWRTIFLAPTKEKNKTFDAEAREDARDRAYNITMRIFRGTDDLPWFKDLQYYNGASSVWKHLDSICGDTPALLRLLMGKTNIESSEQQHIARIAVETAST